jgi:DNA polymerase I
MPGSKSDAERQPQEAEMQLELSIIDVDYLLGGDGAVIRMTCKGSDGRAYEVFDEDFLPYFFFIPSGDMDEAMIKGMRKTEFGTVIAVKKVERAERQVFGKKESGFNIYTSAPAEVPKLSAEFKKYGKCFEYDIPFAKRYIINKQITPFVPYSMRVAKRGSAFLLREMSRMDKDTMPSLNALAFDIEVYNPKVVTMAEKDPIIMISYWYSAGKMSKRGVLTWKKIDRPFVETVSDEKEMVRRFVSLVNELDIDIISGYNSASFDIKYLIDRCAVLGIEFDLSRYKGGTKIERHGMVDRVKISGRVHVDMYHVAKFISVVGSSEYMLKLNRYRLKDVYEAISGGKKMMVDKANIWALWDGTREDLETLADYNLNDSEALMSVYNALVQIMIELSRTTGDMLTDTAVSTTGQLVEFSLMRWAHKYKEVIPNKPEERDIRSRGDNPIEGAYVKTPDPGIYDNLVVFDYRGLYPSIIISHNIDPSTVTNDGADCFESPIGVKFTKRRKGIMPMILQNLMDQRVEVKKAYKKDPSNMSVGARSQALKILSNSFYGYLGYARSRWYSRECAGSVTAYGRQYIKDTIAKAEDFGFRVLYSDTDSVILLLGGKPNEDALRFMNEINMKLPAPMELELEDFYKRGIFVGKKTDKESKGAKKKYALISDKGRIKIRGFELVRRDWSKIARETQRKVLETILEQGSKEKAAEIVREVVKRLKEGKVPLSELVVSTQLKKSISSYDLTSPELEAARKAIKSGKKTREEMEHGVINYVITKHGSTISDKAQLEEFADGYDADYYINNQVLPATMRILKELDFSEEELKNLGKQKKLGG